MSNPIIYNQNQYKNIICEYNKALYSASPDNLRQEIAEAVKISCNITDEELNSEEKYGWTVDPTLPRTKWTVNQIMSVIADPWFSWDVDNCNLNPIFLDDVFEDNPPPVAFSCNPVNNTNGFTNDQQTLIKAIGGINHYLFARTYYIDRCYGTQQYLSFYYNNSEQDFINAHILDFADYVDETGMILGSKLLLAWRDNAFRASINVVNFIKPLAGLFCGDFGNWDNPNIYWWTNPVSISLPWNDNLVMSSYWYNGNGNSININESKLITPLNNNSFPGHRISVNDLYFGLSNTESANLATLFSNNLLKGPTVIANIGEDYDPTCNIEFNWEDTSIEPTGIIPYTLDIITDVGASQDYLYASFDKIDAFDVTSLTTSTLIMCEECDNQGSLSGVIIENADITFDRGQPPCYKTIDVVTDIFIEDLNFRVTKSTINIISITSVNNDSNIIAVSGCDNSSYSSNPTSHNVTQCNISLFDNFEYLMPTGISCVTDIYFENNYLKQRKCTIIVPNKLNVNPDTINIIPLNSNCTNNE